MGIINDKRNVFTQVGVLTSIKDNVEIPNTRDSISSVNNSREIIPFMLDLLVVLKGSEGLKTLFGELMTNFYRGIEPQLKDELRKQTITFNSGDDLPTDFTTTGYEIPSKNIDLYEKYKTDPATQTGGLIYNNAANSFDQKSYQALTIPNVDVTYNNTIINYVDSNDSFLYKPVNSSQTIGNYSDTYIDNLTIISENEFISKVINYIFGTVNGDQNKTIDKLVKEESLNKQIENLVKEEDNLTPQNLREIQDAARKRKEGIQSVDVGCGIIENQLTINDLQGIISGTTGSTDPQQVGQTYLGAIQGSYDPDETRNTTNKETIEDGFFKRLINSITYVLVNAMLFNPEVRALYGITSAFRNNGTTLIGDGTNDLENQRNLADCISKAVKKAINEFIFNLIKTELLNLIIPVSKIILKEKINQYIAILRSLIGISI